MLVGFIFVVEKNSYLVVDVEGIIGRSEVGICGFIKCCFEFVLYGIRVFWVEFLFLEDI